jgi:hypothetical protein
MRVPYAGVQNAQVIVDLGDGADGGPWIAGGGLLIDRDRGRQALDEVDVRLLHLSEKLSGIGGQRLHVSPLALGVDGVEGERAFAGAGEAREHDELVTGKIERDVLQVVLTGTVNDEPVDAHSDHCNGVGRHDLPRGRVHPADAFQ